jgi:hypothetical protein
MPRRLDFGSPVSCSDGGVGELGDVLVDPGTRRLTHVVVLTSDGEARLAPTELLAGGGGGQDLALGCTAAEFGQLETIREFAYVDIGQLPEPDLESDVGVEDVLSVPYPDLGEFGGYVGEFDSSAAVTYDRIPKGTVEIRGSSVVLSADGHDLGSPEAVLVDDVGTITAVVLERGHLWGKRDVTIPVDAAATLETDLVTVGLSRDGVDALPRAE